MRHVGAHSDMANLRHMLLGVNWKKNTGKKNWENDIWSPEAFLGADSAQTSMDILQGYVHSYRPTTNTSEWGRE